MKKLFLLTLAVLFRLVSHADTLNPTVNTKPNDVAVFLRPDGKGNWSYVNVAANNLPSSTPEADAWLATNGITSQLAKTRLQGFQSELKSYGAWSSFVDAIIEKPSLTGSNALSFMQRPLLFTNAPVTNWGINFFGVNSSVTLTGLDGLGLRTNTLVLVILQNITNNVPPGNNGSMMIGGLYNTVTASASSQLYNFWNLNPLNSSSFCLQRNGAAAYNNNTNMILPLCCGGYVYNYVQQNSYERTVWILSSDGNGNIRVWKDGVPCQLNYSFPQFQTPSLGTNTDDMNSLCLGVDLPGSGNGIWGGYAGQIDCALVFNSFCNSNMAAGITRAVRWLEPETTDYYFIGDSRSSPIGGSEWPMSYMAGTGGAQTFQNLAFAGSGYTKVGLAWTNSATSPTNYILPAPACVTRRVILDALGINDMYGQAVTPAVAMNCRNAFAAAFMQPGTEYYPMTIWGIYTSSSGFTWNGPTETNINTFNFLTLSNSFAYTSVPRPDYRVTFANVNTANGYSTDGVHMNGAKGYQVNQSLAAEAKNPTRSPGQTNACIWFVPNQ